MNQATGGSEQPPLSSVLSPLLRRRERKKNAPAQSLFVWREVSSLYYGFNENSGSRISRGSR